MRWLLSMALLMACVLAPAIGAADPPKALVSTDKPDSEYVRDGGVTFALTLGAHHGDLRATVTHLAVGSVQLPPSLLSASIDPPGASQSATLVLRDAAAPPQPALTVPQTKSASAVCQLDRAPPPTGSLRDQGDYAATVEVCETGGAGHATLELRFKKKPGTLRTDATIKLRHIRPLFGFIALPDSTTPSIAIYEASGASDLHLQTPPYRVTLSTPDGTFTANLTPANSANGVTLPAGGSLLLASDITGDAQVGVAQGVAAFQAPELSGGIALVPVEVTTRESLVGLGLVLLVGLLVGIGARQIAEPLRARYSAIADARTALQRLPQPDPTVYDAAETAALDALRETVERVLRDWRSTRDQITTATKDFNADLDTFLKARAQTLATASKALDDWSGPVDEGRDQPPAIAEALSTLKPLVAAGRVALHRLALSAAEQARSDIEKGLEAALDAAASWRREQAAIVARLPAWPEVAAAADAVTAIDKALVDPGDGGAAHDFSFYTKQLQATRAAHQVLRDVIYKVRLKALVDYAVGLRARFGALPVAGLYASALVGLDEARDGLSETPGLGIDAGFDTYAAAETALFEALLTLFVAAAPKPDPGVANGLFEAALKVLATAKTDRALGRVQAPPAQAVVREVALDSAAPAGATPRMRIQSPSSALVGSTIELRIEGLHGTPIAANAKVTWRIGARVVVGGPQLTWTIADRGELPILATLDQADGVTLTASFTVTALPLPDQEAADAAGKKAFAATVVELGISAGVIWITGFTLLGPSYVGTWEQVAAAFLWGFASDLGLAKAVELAKGAAPAPKAA